jgi:hypothetical protein
MIDAEERGVRIVAMLDASNQTKRYSAAGFLAHEGIETYIDSQQLRTELANAFQSFR